LSELEARTDGTTTFSFKVVTTANTKFRVSISIFPPIAIWNDTVGSSVTVTVEGIASAVPNNDEVYMEVEYMGDTSQSAGIKIDNEESPTGYSRSQYN
jgi:hypothetical protein